MAEEDPMPADPTLTERFGSSYWQEDTHYGKLGEYRQALEATKRWYGGLLRAVGPYLPARGRHLDAGCGHGAVVHLLLERGFDSYGFDASEWMIENARQATPETASRFAVGDAAATVPFDGAFDIITSIEVVEHLPQPEEALALMRSRLSDGGTLILTTPNPDNFMPFRNPAMNDPTHVSVHRPQWWRDTLDAHGFSVVHDRTYLALPFVWRYSSALSRWLRFRRDVAPGWLAICKPS